MARFEEDISFFDELDIATKPASHRTQRRSSRELQRLFAEMRQRTEPKDDDAGRHRHGPRDDRRIEERSRC